MSKSKVLFLDRDGTINVDKHYINSLDRLEIIPGTREALQAATKAGFRLAMITNQAGIAKGVTPPDMPAKINEVIEEHAGVRFDDVRVCPHRPEDQCLCRKPGTANFMASAEKLNADLSKSWYIGDHVRDMEMAQRAGVRAILVLTGHGETTLKELDQLATEGKPVPRPSFVANDLKEAVEHILERS